MKNLTKSEKEILKIFIDASEDSFGSKNGYWFIVSDIIAYSGKSEKTVREIIKTFEMNGLLEVESPRGEKNYRLRKGLKNAAVRLLLSDETQETVEDYKEQRVAGEAVELIPGGQIEEDKEGSRRIWGPYLTLEKNKNAIRRNLGKYGPSDLQNILDELREKFVENKSMNPFEAIRLSVKNGIIDGKIEDNDSYSGWIFGTASKRKAPTYSIKIGKIYFPIDFTISAAYGYAQEWDDGKPLDGKNQKVEHQIPETFTDIRTVTEETSFPEDRRGVSKLLKEMVHYELDYSLIDKLRDNGPVKRGIFLRKGILIPSELHPGDLLDKNKRTIVLHDYNWYDKFLDKINSNNLSPFGVVLASDPGRSIFCKIIDEIQYKENDDWKRGILSNLDDNKVLGFLLKEGEYTAILKKNPMADIRKRIYSGLKRDLGLTYRFYEEHMDKMQTYSFFLKPPDYSYAAIRYDFPTKSVDDNFHKAVEYRNTHAPLLFNWSAPFPSSPEEKSKIGIPRSVITADERAHRHLIDFEKALPFYGGNNNE